MNRKTNRELKIKRIGVEENFWQDSYHRMLRMSWPIFFLLFLSLYIGVNVFFGFLYWLNPASVGNLPPGDFFSAFAFSVQTFSTVGYGFFYPKSDLGNAVVIIESAVGLFATAALTGLIFAKFSKPSARIVFSEKMLLSTWNGQRTLSFRMGNMRANRIFTGSAGVTLLKDEVSEEGERLRRLVDLKLVRNETPIFALSWTIYHIIDESSPLFGKSIDDIFQLGWDFVVVFNGLDEDMSQTVVAHTTYSGKDLAVARKFVDMIHVQDGVRKIDFSKLHEVEHLNSEASP